LCSAVIASLLTASGAQGVFGALLAALMLAIAVVDARKYIIPNGLAASAFCLALLDAAWIAPAAGWAAIGWMLARSAAASLPLLALKLAYLKLRGRDGLGLGDVKLAAVAGAWLDWTMIAAVVELAALSAIAAYAIRSILSGRSMRSDQALPFGLFLAPSIWLAWLVQSVLP
jgi:leader peptidase (prepilin peptidase)/N-methyltransferase